MHPRNLITLISLSLLISLPTVASAQKGKDKTKSDLEREPRVEQSIDAATAEQREKMRETTRTRRNTDRDEVDARDEAEDAREKAEEAREEAEDADDRYADMDDGAGDDMKAQRNLKGTAAESKGNEKAQEMRARRDERKAIMEEYKSDKKAGQEADSARGSDVDASDIDSDEVAEEAKEKPKKPWWKIWGD